METCSQVLSMAKQGGGYQEKDTKRHKEKMETIPFTSQWLYCKRYNAFWSDCLHKARTGVNTKMGIYIILYSIYNICILQYI